MQYVDIDGDATTFNSSSATLSMPAGSTVAFAGLYWAGQVFVANRNVVKLKTPGAAAYQTVTASQVDDASPTTNTSYQAFANITSIVAAAGNGVYTVADIQSALGSNNYAGWTLVVVYLNATLPTRNLVVYDGYQRVASNTSPINISLSGFLTPPFGPVTSKLGVVGYDGDRGSTEGTAGLLFGPDVNTLTPVSNAVNPQTDVFNSTISTLGTLNTGMNPSYQNTLGFDADIFAPNTPLPNNATSAAVRVQSSGETIDIGVITMATDIFVPNIKDTLLKSVTKVAGSAGSAILPGDTLEYVMNFYNAGQDGALNVRLTDPIPANTTYLPNSLFITNTGQGGIISTINASDSAGNDTGEFDSANNRIVARVGAGANATQGGTLIPADANKLPSVQVKFRVTVNAQTVGATVIDNFATVTAVQQTLGGTINDVSDANPAVAGDQPARVVVTTADLTITKASVGSFALGQSASYTLTVSNVGLAPSFGTVSVTDTLPAGLIATAISGSGWNCSVATLVCTRTDALAPASSFPAITVTVSVAANAPANVTNSATVACACEAATATGNNSTSVSTPIAAAPILAATKVANSAFVRGQTSSYTLTVTASSAGSATNGSAVTVTDALPVGLSLSGTPTGGGWTCSGIVGDTSVTCTSNDIVAANASFPPITVPVAIALNAPSSITNTMSVGGGGANTSASATATTAVQASADLSVSKTVNTITPNVGDTVQFTIAVNNAGPSSATSVVVNDLLPAGLTFVSATASQGSYLGTTGVWSVGTVTPAASATLTIRATVTSAAAITNVALVSATEPDPASGNNSASVTLQGQRANLSLAKNVSNATPNVGGTVTFTLTVSNSGPDTATNVEVTDLLPTSLDFVSATPTAAYNATTGKWIVGSVAVGAPQTLQIVARPLTPGAITNKAEISKSDQFDPDSTPGNNVAGENDQAQVTLVAQQADLSIAKAVDNPAPVAGETIVYSITVSNAGPSAATGVVVSENIPAGLTLISSTPSQGSFSTPVWNVGSIAANGRAVLTIAARYDGPGQVVNTASITASDQPDPTPNAPVSVTVPSQIADLSLTKTVSSATPNVGSNITFTVTLANAGPNAASGVVVADPLPAGLAFVSSSATVGTYDAASGDWTVGGLNNGGVATLTIIATVTGLAPITNTAEVKASRQFDPNSTPNNRVATENDQASVTITPQSADLRLSKSVTPNNPTLASPNVTYTIRVNNLGPSTATNVAVAESMPSGVTLNTGSIAASTGTFVPGTGIWTIPSLANGAIATLSFTGTVTDFVNPLTNSARITASDQPDPITEPAATATVTGQVADLSLSKTANTATPLVGGIVTFTLTLANAGPAAATGVAVRDLLPAGLSFVSAVASRGSYDPATGLWSVGAIANAGNETLTLTARVTQITAASIVNRAEVAASDQFDPNSTPNNGVAGENDSASFTLTPIPQADLSLAKAAPAALYPGASATYTVLVTNLGPSAAQSVQITDPTPTGLTLQSVSGAGCSALPCALGTLAPGESRSVDVTYSVNFPATGASIANTASVSSTTADPTPGNNSNTAITAIVRDADLRVVKTGATSVVPGTFADYTIVVTNDGPATAAAVQLADPTPAGFTFVGASAPCAAGFPCALGDMAVGASFTVQVRYLSSAALTSGPITNTATATSTGANASPDPNSSNSASTVNTTLAAPVADLSLSKVGPASVLKGESITYTLTVANNGPSDAVGVTLDDPTPAGLTQTGVAGDCSALPCTFATLPVGTTKIVRVTFAVPLNYGGATNPAPIINRASVLSVSADPDGSNNIGTATSDAIIPPAILSVSKTAAGAFVRGSAASYSIVVSALATGGLTTGAEVVVTDSLPAGVLIDGTVNGAGWACTTTSSAAFTCRRSDVLAAGASYPAISVPVRVTLAADASLVNSATAEGGGALAPATGAVTTPVASSADLNLTKSVDRNGPTAAQPDVTFTLVAENLGPSTATATTVQDLLPAGMIFLSATPSLGSYNPVTGAWALGDLAPSTRATLAIRVRITDFTSSITNTATLSSSTADPLPSNNSASATLRGQSANLSLSKEVSNASPNVQSTVDFTLTVRNAGPDTASNVEVTDQLPSGLDFVSAIASSGVYNAVTGVWTVGSVANGSTQTLSLRAKVTSPTPLVNVAEITSSDQFDPNSAPGNGAASEDDIASVTLFPQQSDLRLAKSVNNPNPLRGDVVTYTIDLTNLGPSTATNIAVTETLPIGVQYTLFSPSVGSFDAASGVWSVSSLAAGSRATLTVAGVFRGPAAQTNSAQITALDQYDPTPNDPVSVTIPSQIANLSLTKTSNITNPVQGSNVVFTVAVSNAGPDRATGVAVIDLLPPGLTFVSATASVGGYDDMTGQWAIGSINNGANATLTITARVDSFAPIINTARVSASSQYDPNSVPNNDDATEDDQASVTITPRSADLRLSKRVNNNAPTLASPNVTFTVEVFNAGPDAADNIQVKDALPTGTTLVSATPSVGSVNAPTWSIPTLAANARATLTLVATVTDFTRPITNTAQIIASSLPDPTPNEQASATLQGQIANLVIAKTINNAAPRVGDSVTFTVTLNNTGPDAATGVSVLDQLPSGLSLVGVTPSQGMYDPGTGIWSVGSVAANSTATLQITARVTQTTSAAITNIAEVRTSDQFDPDSTPNNGVVGENDQAQVTLNPVPIADLIVTKVPPAALNPGTNATYTVVVKNLGPSTAQSVQFVDPGPAGLTLVTSSCGTPPCALGNLAAGEERIITLTYRVPFPYTAADPVLNTATVTSATLDPDPSNNSDRVGAGVDARADLAIAKSGPTDVTAGALTTYTITVYNAGPSSAGNVTVDDPLQPGIVAITSVSGGGCSALPCNLGTLAPLQSISVTVVAQIDPAALLGSTVKNVASVSSTTPDPNPLDNSSGAASTVSSVSADLQITKTGPVQALPGDVISFTITVTNAGPSNATNVIVSDLVPANFTITGITGACTALPCTLTNLPALARRTITVSGQVLATLSTAGTLTNVASVTSSTPDPTPNPTATAIVAISAVPDLIVSLTAMPTAIAGDATPLTVTVQNIGGAATNAPYQFAITLPPGASIAATIPGFTCTLAGLTYTCVASAGVATIPVGGSAVFTLSLTFATSGGGSVDAVVGGGGERNLTNDTANAVINVAPRIVPTLTTLGIALLSLLLFVSFARFTARRRTAFRNRTSS